MPKRPNVLLITCDQWRGDSLSAAGHPVVQTPHADALAAEGVLFRRHYGGAAPCAPARACLYTGLYQMTNRVCRNGTPLDHPINRRAIALPLEALTRIPTVILASGGSNKAAVIAAALKGRLASVLITDEQAAAAVLALH